MMGEMAVFCPVWVKKWGKFWPLDTLGMVLCPPLIALPGLHKKSFVRSVRFCPGVTKPDAVYLLYIAVLGQPRAAIIIFKGRRKITMEQCKVITITNQKGGVGKTITTLNLGVGLAVQGKRVMLLDADPQGSLTVSLGIKNPDDLPVSLANIMQAVIDDKTIPDRIGILRHDEGVDLLPSNIELSGTEIALFNTMSRENVLRSYLETVKKGFVSIARPMLGDI